MSRRCDKHDMKLDLFCLGHNTAVCAKCAQNDHFKCPKFVPVEEAAKHATPSSTQRLEPSHGKDERTPIDILNSEENTFTNFVKAAIESGEDNTFTRYLQTNTSRKENVRNSLDTNKFETELATSLDFQLKDGTEEYNTFDEPNDFENEVLNTSRPFSDNTRENISPNVHLNLPELTTKTTKTIETKSEIGQLLEDVKNFSKGLSSRDDVGITLDDLIMKIDTTLVRITENFENTRKQKASIEQQITEIRARLNTHLDELENKLLRSLQSKFRQVESSIFNTIEKLQKGKTEIFNMKNGTVDKEFQANTLLAIRETDKQVRRMKRSINALTENVYAIDMDVKINQDLISLINEIQTLGDVTVNTRLNPKISESVESRRLEIKRTDSKTSRPDIRVKTTPINKQVERSDSKKARAGNKTKNILPKRELVETSQRVSNVQPLPEIELGQHLVMLDDPLPPIVVTSRSGISGIRILQKKKVKIGHKWTSSVSNCKMLPNGRLIFIDAENKRLVVHNKDTYVYRNLRVNDAPRDFAVLDSDRVAVTFGVYIEILNILTSRIEKRIRLEFFECNGISYMDGKFYIYGIFEGYLLSRHGIQILDMSGRVEDRLPITRVQTIHHSIATWKGRIYYTGYSNITCCMASGEELWVFKHDTMDRPKSLTVDSYGNVFATYENENKIVVISVDGLHSKEFELRKHDLYYGQDPRPISVYFDVIESALIVCNTNKDHSVMYFVKYD